MCCNVQRFFCAQIVGLVFWPLAVAAQVGGVGGERSPIGAPGPGGVLSQASDELPQDTTFLALVRARDDALALLSELRRITSYHDKFSNGLVVLFASLPRSSRDTYFKAIDDELQRLKKFEDDIIASTDLKMQMDLAKKFDRDYPLRLQDTRPRPARFRDPNASNDPLAFARRERANANEVFQNVSFENRQFLGGYEKLFSMIESFGNDNLRVPLLDALPDDFYEFAGAQSLEALTEPQIKAAIAKYREVLQKTRDSVAASPMPETADTFRTRLLAQVDELGQSLIKRSTELNVQMGGLEKNMTLAAKSLYGKAVGGDSFNYLLLVFSAVFLVIMVVPRFYPDPVAENVLKSEFLLQFSTVFVLIAAIIILAIGGFIEKNQLPVLLAGISGYVLGQLGSNAGGVPVQAPALNDGPKPGARRQT
jgi:hypothetical protein